MRLYSQRKTRYCKSTEAEEIAKADEKRYDLGDDCGECRTLNRPPNPDHKEGIQKYIEHRAADNTEHCIGRAAIRANEHIICRKEKQKRQSERSDSEIAFRKRQNILRCTTKEK